MKVLGWNTLGVLGLLGAAGLGLPSHVGPKAAGTPGNSATPPGAASLLVVATTANRGEVEPCG
jgi:hypothetical protein